MSRLPFGWSVSVIDGATPTQPNREFLSTETPIFQYAKPQDQMRASRRFVGSIRDLVSDPEKLSYIMEVERLLMAAEDSEYATRLSLSCFDFCISDEVRTYGATNLPLTDAAAVYFRSDVYKTQYPKDLLEAISMKVGYTPNDIIIVPLEIDATGANGLRGVLTERLAYVANVPGQKLAYPQPPVGVPRQELYRELLLCGINPVGDDGLFDKETVIDTGDNYIYRRLHRLRGRLALNASETDLALMKKDIESHWLSVMTGGDQGHVALFGSGVSANEASMRAAAEDGARVFIHPYWYYENLSSVESIFTSVENDPDKASTLLINLEPTNYFTFKEAPEHPIVTIKRFVKKAIKNPDQRHNLVIDATTDPLFSVEGICEASELPNNLQIIKTVSATKHQDGGRSYFFGVVQTSNIAMHASILKNRDSSGGTIYESHVVHFPKPSRRRLALRKKVVSSLNKELEFMTLSEDGWRYKSYSYHSFLMPPGHFIERLNLVLDKKDTLTEREEYVKLLNKRIYEVVNHAARYYGDGIEIGDSFAFPKTRVNTQAGANEVGSHNVALKLPRVSLGYKNGRSIGLSFALELADRVNRAFNVNLGDIEIIDP